MYRMKWMVGVACVGACLVSSASPAADDRPQVGQLHPDFLLPAIDDRRPVRLSDYRGRKVLLIQFASW